MSRRITREEAEELLEMLRDPEFFDNVECLICGKTISDHSDQQISDCDRRLTEENS